MEKYTLADVKNFFLDLIFPRYCLGCKKELSVKQVSHLCETCFNSIRVNLAPQCFICHQRTPDARTCSKCRSKTAICGFLAAGRYEDKTLREAIHYLKYNFLQSLSEPLSEIAAKFIKQNRLESVFEKAILVPVPLTRQRRAQRGFNQSELIAKELYAKLTTYDKQQTTSDNSQSATCQVRADLIKRIAFTKPQADISNFEARRTNVKNAFLAKKPDEIKNLSEQKFKFIIFDDVSTSGATLEACAKILKSAGAKEIWALVIARG